MPVTNFDFLNSYLSDDNKFNDLKNILKWIEEVRKKTVCKVEKKSIFELNNWITEVNNNSIHHSKRYSFQLRA